MDNLDFACEFKLASASDAKVGIVEGYASVFGLIDRGGDVVEPGAFKASLADWRRRKAAPPILWQHDPAQVLGTWTDLVEDDRGLKVTGQLIPSIAKAAEARDLIAVKAVTGLSIGFETRDYEVDRKTGVRRLKKLDLWEVSLVTFPMNPAAQTTGIKAGSFDPATWERAFRDEGLSNREAKLATSVARKLIHRDGGSSEPPPRDDGAELLLSLRKAAAAFRD